MTFGFSTIATADGDRATLVVHGRHYRIDRLLPDFPVGGLRVLMDQWDLLLQSSERLAREIAAVSGDGFEAVENPRILAPLRYPNKLVCVGAVYSDHLIQFDLPPERWERMPIFLRPPTTSIVGPGRTVHIPATTKQFDWEIELAVVIGRSLRAGSEDEARDAIAGFSVGLDMGCRDLLNRYGPAGPDLLRSKAQDGMAPFGPELIPARFVSDPHNLSLNLWVNGEMKQDSTTANMLFSIYEQVAEISQFITLEPGDVVFTGSPAGSAGPDDDWLKPGDQIRASIESVGTLDVTILEPVLRQGGRAQEVV